MTDKLMAIGAYALLLGFLGILVWHVPRLDLAGVVLFTLVLSAVDTAQVLRSHVRNARLDKAEGGRQ
ncbi:hypothetical protein [Paracoccus sp. (in: a-proteobacteria)]|uniref:hypothetical protein n=1 Tax=Paracoccus sp. TaxID=267 RepID=UPI00396CDB06